MYKTESNIKQQIILEVRLHNTILTITAVGLKMQNT